jgi:hypothetical protein
VLYGFVAFKIAVRDAPAMRGRGRLPAESPLFTPPKTPDSACIQFKAVANCAPAANAKDSFPMLNADSCHTSLFVCTVFKKTTPDWFFHH